MTYVPLYVGEIDELPTCFSQHPLQHLFRKHSANFIFIMRVDDPATRETTKMDLVEVLQPLVNREELASPQLKPARSSP